jgi:hypothetical protein
VQERSIFVFCSPVHTIAIGEAAHRRR